MLLFRVVTLFFYLVSFSGGGMDPNGGGGAMDPNGRPRATTQAGGEMDPNGGYTRYRAAPPCSTSSATAKPNPTAPTRSAP